MGLDKTASIDPIVRDPIKRRPLYNNFIFWVYSISRLI
jgi:hypothetical protein